jgi:hypothetical protein
LERSEITHIFIGKAEGKIVVVRLARRLTDIVKFSLI